MNESIFRELRPISRDPHFFCRGLFVVITATLMHVNRELDLLYFRSSIVKGKKSERRKLETLSEITLTIDYREFGSSPDLS